MLIPQTPWVGKVFAFLPRNRSRSQLVNPCRGFVIMRPNPKSIPTSIFLRTRNVDWIIGESLTCLYTQSCKDFDLTVIDYNSTDQTREIVKQFPCNRFMIAGGKYSPAQVLNSIVERSNREILVFMHPDAILISPNSLDNFLRIFDDPSVDGAFGKPSDLNQEPDRELRDSLRTDAPMMEPLPLVAVRRFTWQQNPFICNTAQEDDVDWRNWALVNNLNIQYATETLIKHVPHNTTPSHHAPLVYDLKLN